MCSRCLSVFVAAALGCAAANIPVLRVCADPNNMPFSNLQREGFENKLAEITAAKLGAGLEYTWWSQRKSFVKNSLDEGRCDVLMGIPADLSSVATTTPYYRSTYVFVFRRDSRLNITSLVDPRLRSLRIGIQVVGDDYAPPGVALARLGVTANIVGFSMFGKYGEQNAPRKIVAAVANGEVDVAIVWGPFAGYFAKLESVPLDIVPVSPAMFLGVPFTYEISLGVRKGDDSLKSELNRILASESQEVKHLLAEYNVPQISEGGR